MNIKERLLVKGTLTQRPFDTVNINKLVEADRLANIVDIIEIS